MKKTSMKESVYILKAPFVWLVRIGRCKGFGVQSPNDYSFVCNVVNSHRHHEAYDELAARYPADGRLARKLGRLCMRIAAFRRPEVIVNGCGGSIEAYLRAGCADAAVTADSCDATTVDLLVVPATADGEALTARSMAKLTGRSLLVVVGIKENRAARRFWQALVADERVGVTFDLYYAGVAFFDKKRYKQNYKINF